MNVTDFIDSIVSDDTQSFEYYKVVGLKGFTEDFRQLEGKEVQINISETSLILAEKDSDEMHKFLWSRYFDIQFKAGYVIILSSTGTMVLKRM